MGAFDDALLREATARAPGFAQAWAALAITRALQAKTGDGEQLDDAPREARDAAERALALDPGSGKAYAALALLEPLCGAFAAADALFQKALAAGPDDVDVLEKYSRWLHGVGRSEAALAHITHAFRIDPLYHQGANWYAMMNATRGRLEEAFEVWDCGPRPLARLRRAGFQPSQFRQSRRRRQTRAGADRPCRGAPD